MPGRPKTRAKGKRGPDRSHVRAKMGEDQCPSPKCDRPAGFGTDHLGLGYCFRHGGQHPPMIRNVANAELSALLEEPVEIDPSQALLWCVALAAQDVRWLNQQIAGLERVTIRPKTSETGFGDKGPIDKTTLGPRQLDAYISLRFAAEERLARFSKMALDAGVNERMVALAEQMSELLSPLLKKVLDDLKLTPKQRERAPDIVGAAVRELESTTLAPTRPLPTAA